MLLLFAVLTFDEQPLYHKDDDDDDAPLDLKS